MAAASAHAGPISGCVQDAGTGQLTCDLYLTDGLGNPSNVGTVSPGFDAEWQVGYSFLLTAPDPTQKANVGDVLVIHSDHVDLYSQSAGALFDTWYNHAIAGDAIDGTAIALGQIFGDAGQGPGGGARQFNPGGGAIGLFWKVSDPIAGLLDNSFGSPDMLNIHVAVDFNQTEVPEPATLTLMGLGAAVAAYRRRRTRLTGA